VDLYSLVVQQWGLLARIGTGTDGRVTAGRETTGIEIVGNVTRIPKDMGVRTGVVEVKKSVGLLLKDGVLGGVELVLN
jgi:hypothetical protein